MRAASARIAPRAVIEACIATTETARPTAVLRNRFLPAPRFPSKLDSRIATAVPATCKSDDRQSFAPSAPDAAHGIRGNVELTSAFASRIAVPGESLRRGVPRNDVAERRKRNLQQSSFHCRRHLNTPLFPFWPLAQSASWRAFRLLFPACEPGPLPMKASTK